MKRIFDTVISFSLLFLVLPVVLIVLLLVWLEDLKNPFYIAIRAGKGGHPFKMIKIRSMVIDAENTGCQSTAKDDTRITKIGHFIRSFKIDEITQLFNVLKGEMSLVGPRPQTIENVNTYTNTEKLLLTVRPGITDFSSVVFSDEGQILEGSSDPDLLYNKIIRPWKSRLSILYIENSSMLGDIYIMFITFISLFSRSAALMILHRYVSQFTCDNKLKDIVLRNSRLEPYELP